MFLRETPERPAEYNVFWVVRSQVAVWFPTTRNEVEVVFGHVIDMYDPELKQHLPIATSWLDEVAPDAAPVSAPGSLN